MKANFYGNPFRPEIVSRYINLRIDDVLHKGTNKEVSNIVEK